MNSSIPPSLRNDPMMPAPPIIRTSFAFCGPDDLGSFEELVHRFHAGASFWGRRDARENMIVHLRIEGCTGSALSSGNRVLNRSLFADRIVSMDL
jgi:hypothetical protein